MFCQFFFSSEAKKFAANCVFTTVCYLKSHVINGDVQTHHLVNLELEGTAHLIRLLREQVVRRRACRELVSPVKPGPNKRGICMISVSEARKSSVYYHVLKALIFQSFYSEWRCQAQIFLLGRLDRRQLERATETLLFCGLSGLITVVLYTLQEVNGHVVKLTTELSKGGDTCTVECDTVLVATGRRAFTTGLGLKQMDIQTDKLGCIKDDDAVRTQGIACVENITSKHGHIKYTVLSLVTSARIQSSIRGQFGGGAKADVVEYNVGTFLLMANICARTVAESDGMVMVLADTKTDKMVRVHIIAT
ncbi:hypothetical protein KXD40_009085 [Peronospora effusa]|nr:hypothetical protein KXD40_009085 [Peronospora effusa]